MTLLDDRKQEKVILMRREIEALRSFVALEFCMKAFGRMLGRKRKHKQSTAVIRVLEAEIRVQGVRDE